MLKVANAILFNRDQYVLHLRDNIPTIPAAGKWALFGGQVEADEDSRTAIIREIKEELCISLDNPQLLWVYDHFSEWGDKAIFIFFICDVTKQWEEHRLTEGQAVGCFSYDQIAELDVQPFIRNVLTRYHKEKSRQGGRLV